MFLHLSLNFVLQASIVRNQKDTAHTKAERNILEAVKVCLCVLRFMAKKIERKGTNKLMKKEGLSEQSEKKAKL